MSTPSVLSALRKLIILLGRQEKNKALCIAAFAVVSSFFEVITASLIVIFAQVLSEPNVGLKYLRKIGITSDWSQGQILLYFAIAVWAVYFIKNLFAAAEIFFQNFSIQLMSCNFKNRLLHKYLEIDYSFYLTRNSSLGVQIVGGDTELMFSTGMVAFSIILSEGIVFCILVSLIVYLNPPLAFIIFGLAGGISLFLIKVVLPHFYQFGLRLQQASTAGWQTLLQFFHAFKEIILLGKREQFIDLYNQQALEKAKTQALQTSFNNLPRIIIEVLFIGLFVVAIAVLAFKQDSPAQMMGILGGYLYAGFRLMPGLNRIINQLNLVKSNIPSIERVYAEYTNITAADTYKNIPDFHFDTSITFKNVCFRYLNAKIDALQDINLEIRKGESVGIVGETGSGKSTIVDSFLGLLVPQAGDILIDGKFPANSIQWHQKIGYVPQALYLLDDTVENNIVFGDIDIDPARLNSAIEAAQLKELIKKLPQGLQTTVGERGVRLSGGERQRISIARALYRNPEILILDEATSALDNETEARLMETIDGLSQDRTIIMIAHRLSTLKNCDRIIMMDKGRLEKIVAYKDLIRLSTEKKKHA